MSIFIDIGMQFKWPRQLRIEHLPNGWAKADSSGQNNRVGNVKTLWQKGYFYS